MVSSFQYYIMTVVSGHERRLGSPHWIGYFRLENSGRSQGAQVFRPGTIATMCHVGLMAGQREPIMSMPQEIQHRFDMLQGRFIDAQYLTDYYGLDGLADNATLLADMARHRETLRNPPSPRDGMTDRYVLEAFLQTRRLLPIKWAAARLGMKQPMLVSILDRRLELPTPLRKEYLDYGCLVEEGLSEDLLRALPQMRFRTFYDHESFCDHLHAALTETLKLAEPDVQDGKLWCSTDRRSTMSAWAITPAGTDITLTA